MLSFVSNRKTSIRRYNQERDVNKDILSLPADQKRFVQKHLRGKLGASAWAVVHTRLALRASRGGDGILFCQICSIEHLQNMTNAVQYNVREHVAKRVSTLPNACIASSFSLFAFSWPSGLWGQTSAASSSGWAQPALPWRVPSSTLAHLGSHKRIDVPVLSNLHCCNGSNKTTAGKSKNAQIQSDNACMNKSTHSITDGISKWT